MHKLHQFSLVWCVVKNFTFHISAQNDNFLDIILDLRFKPEGQCQIGKWAQGQDPKLS